MVSTEIRFLFTDIPQEIIKKTSQTKLKAVIKRLNVALRLSAFSELCYAAEGVHGTGAAWRGVVARGASLRLGRGRAGAGRSRPEPTAPI